MPRTVLDPRAVPIRTSDLVKALAEKTAKSLSLVVDREIRFAVESFEAVTAPLEEPSPAQVGFEFSGKGAASGRILVVVSLPDALSLSGLLCMVSQGQIQERRREPVLGPGDTDSLHEIGNILRGAIEEAIRIQSPVQLHVAAAGADAMPAIVGDRAATWPRSLSARATFHIDGFDAGPAEILIEMAVAKALDPGLEKDAASSGRAGASPGASPGASRAGLPTLIVLEPDAFYMRLVVAAVAASAHVVAAPSVKKLRALLEASPRATIVVDVADGDAEMLKTIAAIRRLANAPAVLATLETPKRSLVVQLAQAGVEHILPKPYSRLAIASRLKALLAK